MAKNLPEKGAIDLLEEAVRLLRSGGLPMAFPYYLGAIPFVCGILFFHVDMAGSPYAKAHAASYSLGLALLFVWMKTCQALFGQAMAARLNGTSPPGWRMIPAILPSQALIHALGLLALPLALLLALPLGWTWAFCLNAACINLKKHRGFKAAWRESWRQAALWPVQNHVLLSILSLFSLVVLINVMGFLSTLPWLLKTFLGVETRFSMSPVACMQNTTFWAAALGLTYLCADPLFRAVYALRCHYGGAMADGSDLRARLRTLFPGKASASLALLMLAGLMTLGMGAAQAGTPEGEAAVSGPALERSIKEVMQRPVFSWRLPRETQVEEKRELPGFIQAMLDWVKDTLNSWAEIIQDWWRKLMDWLDSLFPDPEKETAPEGERSWTWPKAAHVLLWILLGALAVTLALFAYRTLKARKAKNPQEAIQAQPVKVNILDENTAATDLPVNSWLDMARDLLARGCLTEALRAYYLAALAHLAQNNLLTIARYKSNRDYILELQRRAHARQGLVELFPQGVAVFEKHWYGMHPVTGPDVQAFAAWQDRILAQ